MSARARRLREAVVPLAAVVVIVVGLSLSIAIALSFDVFAPVQEDVGGIEGTVIDQDGSPVPGMRVGIVSGTTGFPEIAVMTDDEGHYRIGSVPAGTFEVGVHDLEGNRVALGSVTVRGGETSTLNFVLQL